MNCRSCPYAKEDFNKRMYWYEKTIKEQGIPNNIYKYLLPEDAPNEFEQFLWCDKVGGKVYCAGRCSDAYLDAQNRSNCSKKKRRNKRERDQKYKNHLKSLAKNTQRDLFPVVFIENSKPYYKKLYRGRGKGKSYYCKKISNKKIRRYKDELPKKGNFVHHIYNYFWWDLS